MDPTSALRAAASETHARIEALRRDLAQMTDSADTATDDEHDPEGTTAFERAQTRALLAAATAAAAEIEAAQRRVQAGTYGRCEHCGETIPSARLAARPTARTCVGCVTR